MATARPRSRRKKPEPPPPPTLGPWVSAWMEEYLVHSQGDWLGRPFRLRRWQRRIVYELYELNPDGTRRYNRALIGLPKGNGKSELAAAVAVTELAGPVICAGFDEDGDPIPEQRVSPDIPVGAASYHQADLVFGAASAMIARGPLADDYEVFQREIRPRDPEDGGVLYRVAAVAGPNDGLKPSFFVADELHEWLGGKERVHLVISNGRAKRRDSWELNITTAGWNLTSLLGRMYRHGKRVQEGRDADSRFYFHWREPTREHDLADPDQLRAAILEANPAADPAQNPEHGAFLDVENVVQRYAEIPEFEFRRYHLDQWTTAPDRWFEEGVWESRAKARVVTPEEPIAVGFDGSYSGDSTAIVGCTINDPHLFKLGHWERTEQDDEGWRVDVSDVEARLREIHATYNVVAFGCDPFRWQRTMAVLSDEGIEVLEWASHLPSRMVPACAQFYDAVKATSAHGLTHDGDPDLARHVTNCVIKEDSRGPRITKETARSLNKIDLAVAGVIAYDLAHRETARPSRYEEEGAELGYV